MKNQLQHNFRTVDDGFRHVHKEMNDKDRTIKHYISSGDSNRYGQILPIEGFQENDYRKNPIVMFQHGTSDFFTTTPAMDQLEFVIGSNLLMHKESNYLLGTTKFRKGDVADDVYEGYKMGWLNAWSKYWYPISEPEFKDGFLTVNQWGIFEYSSVLIPVDANAVTDLDANKNMLSIVKSQVMKNMLSKNILDKSVDVEIEKLIQPLKDQINSLKDEHEKYKKEVSKEINDQIFNSIKLYNKQLSETLPGIVGDKIITQLNKIGINNLDNVIDNKVAGAIRKVTGIL